jgi:hypothetical protein
MKNRLSWQKIGIAELTRPSVATLLIANVLPLFGVLFLGWKIFPLLVLFWLENVIVGVFNVFKMLVASPTSPGQWVAKLGMIPFFCFHYGMFTLVHGIFVFVMFGGILMDSPDFPTPAVVAQVFGDFQIGWAALALFISHLVSFIFNYIGKGEYKQSKVNDLMAQPYGRVVILHVTIILGGFLIGMFGSPIFALILLLVLKTVIDIQAHLREHKKFSEKQAETVGAEGRE